MARAIQREALWLSVTPLDMDTIFAQAVRIFGVARPHYAYLFANRRGTRMKVLIHDGQEIWLACRRLNQGCLRPVEENGSLTLTQTQFDTLRFSVKMGLPEAYYYTNDRQATQSIQREPAMLTVNAIGIAAKVD